MVYEYSCEHCKNKFEKSVPLKNCDVEQECPDCGGISVKVPSLSSFHLKGGGWCKDSYQHSQQ